MIRLTASSMFSKTTTTIKMPMTAAKGRLRAL